MKSEVVRRFLAVQLHGTGNTVYGSRYNVPKNSDDWTEHIYLPPDIYTYIYEKHMMRLVIVVAVHVQVFLCLYMFKW